MTGDLKLNSTRPRTVDGLAHEVTAWQGAGGLDGGEGRGRLVAGAEVMRKWAAT